MFIGKHLTLAVVFPALTSHNTSLTDPVPFASSLFTLHFLCKPIFFFYFLFLFFTLGDV